MSLEIRIAQLERRCRALTIVLAGSLLLVAVGVLAGGAQVNESQLRFQQLDVRDPNGNVRVHIGRVGDAYGVFVLDAAGQAHATVSDSPQNAIVSVDKGGGAVQMLAVRQGADITIRDARGRTRAATTLTGDNPEIQLRSSNGELRFIAPAEAPPVR